jgi:hypothetical protein
MNDRLERLLAEQAQQEEARLEAERVAAVKQAERAAHALTVAAIWSEKRALLDEAVNEFNSRLKPVGRELSVRADDKSTLDLDSFVVHDATPGMHAGRLRVTKNGQVFVRVSSDNLSDWNRRDSTVEALDREFLDDFLADVLEARLKPAKPPA